MNLSQGDSKFTIQKGDEEQEDLCWCSPGLNTRETQTWLCFIHACNNGSVSRFISLAADISVPWTED